MTSKNKPVRYSKARVLFMQHLALHSPTTRTHAGGPRPSADSMISMYRAGLFTTRDVEPFTSRYGNVTYTLEFTITDAGREWLRKAGALPHA